MTANVNRRHARTKGQPRRTWAPLGEVTHMLPVLEERLPVLSPMETAALQDRFTADLWKGVAGNLGAVSRLASRTPRFAAARSVAAVARYLAWLLVYGVCLGALIAIAPVLHGLGV